MDAKLNPCVAHEARYVIAEIHESSGNDEFFTLRPVWSTIYKESYMALTRRKGGYLLYYADTSLVSIYTPKLMASVGGMLSGNFRSGLTHFNHRDFYQSAVEFQPDDLQMDEYDYIINNFEDAPVTRITQDHHLFVNTPELKEIFKTAKKNRKAI